MSDDGWIVIPNWPQFQHYKDRDPLWLKEYISQLHDDRLRKLSLALRGLLFSLHLLYAASDGRVQKNALAITHELGCRVTDEQIDALNHAGFITIAASRPLALSRARARARVREEESREENDSASKPASKPRTTTPRAGSPRDNGDTDFEPPDATVKAEMLRLAHNWLADHGVQPPGHDPDWTPTEDEPF